MFNDRELDAEALVRPYIADYNTSVYAQYSVLVSDRDAFQANLSKQGIPTAVHYPVPLNKQPAMANQDCKVPVAEEVSERVISLPMHPYITESEQCRVVDAVAAALTA